MRSLRAVAGDIFELPLEPGFAYLRFVRKIKGIGDVVGLIDRVSRDRASLPELCCSPDSWFMFFALSENRKLKLIEKVGRCPGMTTQVLGYRKRGVGHWEVFDVDGKERVVPKLSSEELRFPIVSGNTASTVRDWIRTGFDPSKDRRDKLEYMQSLIDAARSGG